MTAEGTLKNVDSPFKYFLWDSVFYFIVLNNNGIITSVIEQQYVYIDILIRPCVLN